MFNLNTINLFFKFYLLVISLVLGLVVVLYWSLEQNSSHVIVNFTILIALFYLTITEKYKYRKVNYKERLYELKNVEINTTGSIQEIAERFSKIADKEFKIEKKKAFLFGTYYLTYINGTEVPGYTVTKEAAYNLLIVYFIECIKDGIYTRNNRAIRN